MVEGMGHDVPRSHLSTVVDAVSGLAAGADAPAR